MKKPLDVLKCGMVKQYTKKSDINVYIAAAENLGLNFEIISKRNPTVILSHAGKQLLFRNTSPSFNSLAGHQIASDKYMTSKLLQREGIPVPKASVFKKEDIKNIISYARGNYPVVLKRNKGSQGKGVHVNINTLNHLFTALHDILKSDANEVLVEKFVEGKDFRIIVFRGEVIDIIERVPAYVIGDGKSTISALIDKKNKIRIKTLGGYIIKKDDTLKFKLKSQKLQLKTVLEKDKYLKLNDSCNYSSGGETKKVDLGIVHKDNLDLFRKIQTKVFLDYVGIDLITKDISRSWKENGAMINEVNSSIGIDTHYYADMGMDLSAPIKVLKKFFEI